MKSPIVSVLVVTYNHGKYISQCLQSAVAQQTDFPIEIVVADDGSTDDTRKIIADLAARYPHVIKPIFQPENVGMIQNVLDCFGHCTGKYIACLDGDDYWTNELKLQKQVDFLERNPDFTICAHSVDELQGGIIRPVEGQPAKQVTYSLRDLAAGNLFHTASVVYRNGLFKEFPVWLKESPVLDYVFHMLNARYGKIKYLPEVMAVYRRHDAGVWSTMSEITLFERWIKVLMLLLTEPFEEEVAEQLKIQKNKNATEYLKRLLLKNHELFLQKLKTFAEADPEFGNEWLLKYLPDYILRLTQSKSYRLGQKISRVAGFFKKIIKR